MIEEEIFDDLTKFTLYGLYKQSKDGDCPDEDPEVFFRFGYGM